MKRIMTVTALSLALISGYSWASTTPSTPAATKAETSSSTSDVKKLQELTKVANEGYNAMRNVQYARLAIFSGDTKLATKLVDQSEKFLNDDSVEWSKFVKQAKNPDLTKNDDFVVINASISLAENYTITPEKQVVMKSVITKANEKLKNNDVKGALDDLHLAGIAVNETQYLMPLKLTRSLVTQAKQLLESGQYYEANLVLRDAEKAIIINSDTLLAD